MKMPNCIFFMFEWNKITRKQNFPSKYNVTVYQDLNLKLQDKLKLSCMNWYILV